MKTILMYALISMMLVGCTGLPTGDITADIKDDPQKVTIYWFWGEGCPHCKTQEPFIDQLEDTYGEDIQIKRLETWKNPDNAQLFKQLAQANGFQARGVPTTIIGDDHWVGYADHMNDQITNAIDECLENGCPNPADKLR